MKTLVIGLPENLPPELADDPAVLVIDPQQLGDEVLTALNAASGGLLLEEGEGGEGPLADWAGEEEAEHGMGRGGRGDEEDEKDRGGEGPLADWAAEEEAEPAHGRGGYGDDDEEPKDEERMGAGRGGRRGGRGDEPEDEEPKDGAGRGRGRGGRGPALPPLAAWARAMAGGRGR